jgi:hypothetical protein
MQIYQRHEIYFTRSFYLERLSLLFRRSIYYVLKEEHIFHMHP